MLHSYNRELLNKNKDNTKKLYFSMQDVFYYTARNCIQVISMKQSFLSSDFLWFFILNKIPNSTVNAILQKQTVKH